MKQQISILLCYWLFISCPLLGQDGNWSLEKCIDYAKEHNLQIKSTNYDLMIGIDRA